eukprot:m.144328 g.144328  ORF g.144328 m.144328 type:complete len:304 (-) comp10061_c0_seq2:82-993(-)
MLHLLLLELHVLHLLVLRRNKDILCGDVAGFVGHLLKCACRFLVRDVAYCLSESGLEAVAHLAHSVVLKVELLYNLVAFGVLALDLKMLGQKLHKLVAAVLELLILGLGGLLDLVDSLLDGRCVLLALLGQLRLDVLQGLHLRLRILLHLRLELHLLHEGLGLCLLLLLGERKQPRSPAVCALLHPEYAHAAPEPARASPRRVSSRLVRRPWGCWRCLRAGHAHQCCCGGFGRGCAASCCLCALGGRQAEFGSANHVVRTTAARPPPALNSAHPVCFAVKMSEFCALVAVLLPRLALLASDSD